MSVKNPRVRLTVDLTRYNPKLTVGQEGTVIGPGQWGYGPMFDLVEFDCGVTQNIVSKSLDIIDPEFLEWSAENKRKHIEGLSKATDVVLTLGPRGGFRTLSYQYPGSSIGSGGTGSKDQAEEDLKIIRSHKIPVKTVVE